LDQSKLDGIQIGGTTKTSFVGLTEVEIIQTNGMAKMTPPVMIATYSSTRRIRRRTFGNWGTVGSTTRTSAGKVLMCALPLDSGPNAWRWRSTSW
jgi:hypothetical protein